MWTATIHVTICVSWLCRAIHGDEVEIPLSKPQPTEQDCLDYARLVASTADAMNPTDFARYPRRITCENL